VFAIVTMNSEPTAECTVCKAPMDASVAGPCLNCGATGTKLVYATMPVTAKVTPSIEVAKIHSSILFNKGAIVALIVITLVSPLITFFLPGLLGIATSYALSIVGIVVGHYAITKVRDIERYINR
jgi:hypothetical protein